MRWALLASVISQIAASDKSSKRGWNAMGSMLQMRDQSTVHFSSRAKRSLASRASRFIWEDGGIEIALIESGLATANHGSDDTRECFHAAHGADGVGVFACDRANFECQLCGGGKRVAARVHWS